MVCSPSLASTTGSWGLVAGSSFPGSTAVAAAGVALLSINGGIRCRVGIQFIHLLGIALQGFAGKQPGLVIVGQCGKLVRILHEGLKSRPDISRSIFGIDALSQWVKPITFAVTR